MARDVGKLAGVPRLPASPCGDHRLGGDATFTAVDCVCGLGMHSPRSQGAYARPRIGVMLDGTFHARSQQGSVVVGPGALLLGRAGAGYEYRHLDDGGDRSVVFDYDPALVDADFRAASVPASVSSAAAVALTREALRDRDGEALREAAWTVVAIAVNAGRESSASPLSAEHERRIAHVLRYIEAHHADDCSLDTLAAHARLSSFHFLRTFRRVSGQTPRQVVIATRLRAAAARLRAGSGSVSDIAFAVGFGDLSHFMASFTRAFGCSPGVYRRRAA